MIVCAYCGNTKREAAETGAWLHVHDWFRWSGVTHEVSLAGLQGEARDG